MNSSLISNNIDKLKPILLFYNEDKFWTKIIKIKMKIESVHIKNFRSFKNETILFDDIEVRMPSN